eukprot:736148-Pyramimonas_sp.AAC.1
MVLSGVDDVCILAVTGAENPFPATPALMNYDEVTDNSAVTGKGVDWGGMTLPAYNEPDEVTGTLALRSLNKIVDAGLSLGASGLDITGGVLGVAMGAGTSKMFNTVGFLFAYELMTGTLRTKILATDNSHTLGAL